MGCASRLQAYPWPGNIRERQNVMERACVMAMTPIVDIDDALPVGTIADPQKGITTGRLGR